MYWEMAFSAVFGELYAVVKCSVASDIIHTVGTYHRLRCMLTLMQHRSLHIKALGIMFNVVKHGGSFKSESGERCHSNDIRPPLKPNMENTTINGASNSNVALDTFNHDTSIYFIGMNCTN